MKYKESQVATVLLGHHKGFRNDYCYGSGVTDALEVIKYEVLELGNIDILETSRQKYNIKMDLRNKKQSIEILHKFLINYYGSRKLNVLWLSTYDSIMNMYGGSDSISTYFIPKNSLILSDLGFDGVLLVSNQEFILLNEGGN